MGASCHSVLGIHFRAGSQERGCHCADVVVSSIVERSVSILATTIYQLQRREGGEGLHSVVGTGICASGQQAVNHFAMLLVGRVVERGVSILPPWQHMSKQSFSALGKGEKETLKGECSTAQLFRTAHARESACAQAEFLSTRVCSSFSRRAETCHLVLGIHIRTGCEE